MTTPIKEYQSDLANMDVGQTLNFHHCKTGRQNDRLYVTRKPDGYLYHCFHCGYRGFLPEAGYIRKPRDYYKRSLTRTGHRRWELPDDTLYDISQFPVHARGWLYKSRLDNEDITNYRIGFSRILARIILPVWNGEDLQGFQTRRVFDWDKESKYKTYKNVKELYFQLFTEEDKYICLCEDMLSAVRLYQHVPSVALLGTNLGKELHWKLINSFAKKVFIFLDDDNLQVRQQQIKIKNKLDNFKDVKIISVGTDPKNLSDKELDKLLWN